MRAMPASFKRAVAATIIGANQWDAGIALMKSGNPDGWAQLASDATLVSANRDKITACRESANKATHDERCTIIVQPAPRH